MSEQVNKSHHKSKEGKGKIIKDANDDSRNPKAFALSGSGRRAVRQQARNSELKERRLHVPLIDRLPEEAPPLIVGVVGPPSVGKTTLIKSLIRRYTKQTLSAPTGPLTVVTSKRRRLTFIECPSYSLAAMIDLAKVVDIVLLMIDGKFGFEMETMEFLNVLSASGMPGNIFGILTHLDLFKKQDTLREQKKRLKHRFWSELYSGAKLFFLSGVFNGRYPNREVLNISRFLSVMKNPRPLVWRNSHPYCIADRFLDATPPTKIEENPKCDRTIALYGYLRGTNFPARGARVHVPGLGDLDVAEIEALPDPCPTPYQKAALEKATGKPIKKRLGEKQRLIFGPMSDVGGVLVDKDAVYIDVKTSTFDPNADAEMQRGLGEKLMIGLQSDRKLLGQGGGVRLFGDDEDSRGQKRKRRPLYAAENGVNGVSESESEADQPDVAFADSDSEGLETDEDDEHLEDEDLEDDEISEDMNLDADQDARWKENLSQRAIQSHSKRRGRIVDLARLMYDLTLSPETALRQWRGEEAPADEPEDDDLFKRKKADVKDAEDRMFPAFDFDQLAAKWRQSSNKKLLRKRFTSSKTREEDEEDGSEGDGDFEDLEANDPEANGAETNGAKTNGTETNGHEELTMEEEREKNARKREQLKQRFEEEDRDGFANDKANARSKGADAEQFAEDEWYDAQKAKIQRQLEINKSEYEAMDERSRILTEGYRAGTYARILLANVPHEFAEHFDPRMPLIIGGLSPTEDRFGFVQVRIKRHRWHQKILKTNDPLIFSLGWRRFQSLPVYSISDSRTRNRMLKYTPEHMHCFGSFYGPLIAPNTGFCAVQSLASKSSGFRVAATGVVLNVDESVEIVKKLKLKGHPHKVYKNTAIIKDMFSSELEVAKFRAANLRTVSGIRGMVKGRAGAQYPDGYIRAGFEDKILMSDIVFLSAWRQIFPPEFYAPVTNLLMPQRTGKIEEEETEPGIWTGMRLTGAVRAEQGMKTPVNKNSLYAKISREERHFNPLRVPRKLAAELPFKSQVATVAPQRKPTYVQRRAVVLGGEEKRARDLMNKVMTVRNDKVAKRREAQEKRRVPYQKKLAEQQALREEREKREKREYWAKAGKRGHQGDAAGGGGGGGGKRRKL